MSKQIKIAILADGKMAVAEFKNVGAASKYLGDQASTSTGHLESMRAKLRSISDGLDAAGRKMMSTGRTMTVGMSLPIVAGFGAMIKAAQESNKISKITEQLIRNTGGAANISADEIGDLAMAISRKTGVDDEAIQSSQNLLLSFGKIRNEVGEGNDMFNRASQAAVDMSTVFGGLDMSSKALGKALEDPVKGLGALGKAGVKFTADQKDQIKAMVETGDLLGAQALILGEVEGKFLGVAEKSSTSIDKMKNNVGNMAETLGKVLVPWLEKASAKVSEWTEKFQALSPKVQRFVVIGGLLLAALGPIVTVLGAVVTALGVMLGPVGLVIVGLGLLVAAFVKAYRSSETFRDIVKGVIDAVKKAVGGLVDAAKLALEGKWGEAWDKAVEAVRGFGADVKDELAKIDWTGLAVTAHQFGLDLKAEAETWALNVATSLKQYDWLGLGKEIWGLIYKGLKSGFDSGKSWLAEVGIKLADQILPGSQFSEKMYRDTKKGMDASRDAVDKGGRELVSAAGAVGAGVKREADKFGTPIATKMSTDVNGAVGAVKAGAGPLSVAGARLKAALVEGLGSGGAGAAWAAAVIAGMRAGLAGGAGTINAAAANLVAGAIAAGKRAQAQASPSRKWYEIGDMAVEGFATGLEEKTPRATKAATTAAKAVTFAFAKTIREGIDSVKDLASRMMQEIDDAVSAVQGKYGAGKSKAGAERDLVAATKELGEVRSRNASLPGRMAAAEARLAEALAGGEDTVKDVADAQRDLDELRRESVSSASELERAELALVEAQDRLNDATIAAWKAENDLEKQGPGAIQRWRDYATAAGLAADQVERVVAAIGRTGGGTPPIVPPAFTPPGTDDDRGDLGVPFIVPPGGGGTGFPNGNGGFGYERPGGHLTINIAGSVTTERDLVDAVRIGLVRGADSGFATFAPV